MTEPTRPVRAVIWDFGGVVTSSPFDAFARYEAEAGLPSGFIRQLNARNPDSNAWALFERSEVDVATFCRLFEAEAAEAGHPLEGERVIACLAGEIRPRMVAVLNWLSGRYRLGCITNNVRADYDAGERRARIAEVMKLFDVVIESREVGIRKPEPRIYEIACERLEVTPAEAVYLDDLGVNLKPARAMGMHTIKVTDPDEALAELERALGATLP